MPTQEELIDRGRRASMLLADRTFQEAIDELSTMHLRALVAAPPGDRGKEARDYHHLLHYALSELGNTILGYSSTGLQAEALLEAQKDHY